MNDRHDNPIATRRVRVLAVTRRPGSASFEHRVLDHVAPLARRGVEVAWREIPAGSAAPRALLDEAAEADVVWWHRYLIGPWPWALGRWRKAARRIAFDFDDPLTYRSRGGVSFGRRAKFAMLLARCDAVLAGNEYLAELARPHGRDVTVLPMAVPIPEVVPRPPGRAGRSELLWLGGRATGRYLDELMAALDELAARRPEVTLRVVGHAVPPARRVQVDFRPWSPAEQEAALRECRIGLCPMPDTPWTRGKCPYKVLQYMAFGMAWVGSAVGENVRTAGVAPAEATGLLAADDGQWVQALTRLVDDPSACEAMGARGRAYVEANHSEDVLADRLAGLFRRL